MWSNLGKKIQTFFLIFIVVLLSLVMGVVGFGQPSGEGCTGQGPGYAAEVYGTSISEGEFRAAYIVTGFNRYPVERAQTLRLREYTLDGLIERELLTREADRLGFGIEGEEVMREVASEEIVRLGGPIDAPAGYPRGDLQQSFRDRDGALSRDHFERFVQNYLRRSVEEFVIWQVAEARANRVREMVTASVSVSSREVWDSYVQENDRAQLSYVKFDPAYYESRVEVTDEAIGTWMEANAEDIDAEYRRQRHRYTNLEEQVRVRHILVEVAHDASDGDRESARRRAEALLAEIEDGGDFAELARANSSDEGSATRGGDLDWFPRGRRAAPFEEAAFDTDPGNVVDHIIDGRFGFHIIEVQGRRSGDVPEDEAKREIAESLYRTARAGELAREDADRALAYLRDGHTTEDLDERFLHGWEEPSAEEEEPSDEDDEDEEEEDIPERDPRAPIVRETLSFARSDRAVPTDDGSITQAAFEMTMDDPLPDEPIEVRDTWYVIQLAERNLAEEEGFDEGTQDRLRRRLVERKRREVLSAYIGRLRAQAETEGAIRINPGIISYGTPNTGSGDGEEETGSSDDETSS